MDLIYIANTGPHVDAANAAGVDRIMVDLEVLGKKERQGHLNTVISHHTLDDVAFVRSRLTGPRMMVRVNPIHETSVQEINDVISMGAETIMLPMFKAVEEVEVFLSIVRGRARACLLLETAPALARAERILGVRGIDEVHVGLNDLHLALGLDFMFEVLTGGLLDHLSRICRNSRIKFGFGGIARPGHGLLPATDILMEHVRLGSTQVILSRDFHAIFGDRPIEAIHRDFATAVADIRDTCKRAEGMSAELLALNQIKVADQVSRIVAVRSKPRPG